MPSVIGQALAQGNRYAPQQDPRQLQAQAWQANAKTAGNKAPMQPYSPTVQPSMVPTGAPMAPAGGLMGTSRAPLNPDWQPKQSPGAPGSGVQQMPQQQAQRAQAQQPYQYNQHNPLDRGQSMYGPKPVNQGFGYDRSFGPGQTAPTKSFGG